MLKTLPELIREVSANVRVLDADSAREEAGDTGGLLIDVREPPEVAADPSPAELNIPRGLLEIKLPEAVQDPARPIYVHCATGGRARLAAEQLQRIGYTRVTAVSCAFDRVREAFRDE